MTDLTRYRVQFFQDDVYEVLQLIPSTILPYGYEDTEDPVFQGSLSDCEAYIRLHEGGYM